MHFCYGFGAFVSPMIAEPFLLNEDCTPFIGKTACLSVFPLVKLTQILKICSINLTEGSMKHLSNSSIRAINMFSGRSWIFPLGRWGNRPSTEACFGINIYITRKPCSLWHSCQRGSSHPSELNSETRKQKV